ncbi:hypothetical protein DTW90_03005 [Neorhizobium sp. P12A]|jgi:hypothetical protein|uniref:hypothetical protein n=1 Tax=Rhizobium/Agrobacterium group TaxID=227290 RepID=UPI00104EE395|nr:MULTISPECIES: hypothetical protein [Rhizobium/Agrobacterium group]KAA0700630.1 hypothetical protein DTW90_03005 [Neorhizobium sp. P12A]TCR91979.1 hypothetical protein EV561_102423 [Rhizobium sp. BK376]
MALGRSRWWLVAVLAVAATSCQTEDKAPLPRYTSNGPGAPAATADNKANRHFIEFRSRYALTYGHTYVVFGTLDAKGNMINPEVAGLAPASPDAAPYVIGHIIPVPATTGATDGDLEEQYRSASWRVMLSDSEYNDVVAFIRKQQATSHFWQATVDNCNNWVGQIAAHMGYKTPAIWLRPQQFITNLREMNT